MDRLLKFMPQGLRQPAETLLTGSGEGARSGRGALAAFIIRIASAFLAFLSQVLLARWMGAFEFGVFSYGLTDFQDGVGRAQGWIDLALIPPYILRPIFLFAFIGIFYWVARPPDAATAALALVGACWLTALVQYLAQKRRFDASVPKVVPAYATRHWVRTSLPLFMIDGFTLFILNLDVLLLEYLRVPPDQIGIYFAALKTLSLIAFVHFSISAVAMPRFAALYARGETAEIRQFLVRMQKWCFFPSALGAAVLLIIGKPLLWLFGPDFITAY